jgi:hypothetical protein
MVKKALWLIHICLIAACNPNYDAPCRDPVISEQQTIPAYISAIFPYGAKDTLVFKDVNNDSLIFTSTFFNNTPFRQRANKPNNPDCPNDWILFENKFVGLYNNRKGIWLYFQIVSQNKTVYIHGHLELELNFAIVDSVMKTQSDSIMHPEIVHTNVGYFKGRDSLLYGFNNKGLLSFSLENRMYYLTRFIK